MPRDCPACGTRNPDQARFCFSCATPFDGVRERRERKFATVLFADLVGYTSLSERSDPEVVRSLVARTFDRFSEVIRRHGGTTEKFMGDAVLAVFGVPAVHEDDPVRAVRAALEMQAALEDLNVTFVAEGRDRLALRVGIEAGDVLVDLDRVEGTRDRMLTGDTVNTAARLEQSAEAGRVVVGPVAHAASRRVVEYRPLAPLRLKGKTEPVPAFEALSVTPRPSEHHSGLHARLVGRGEEVAALDEAFRRTVADRRPGLVTILGPAGVGKSRLAREFVASIQGRATISQGRCLAYGNVSYSALADAVKTDCGILEDDPPGTVLSKIERFVEGVDADPAIVPALAALAGSAYGQPPGRQELFDAWRRFLEERAAAVPLLLLFEDLHWADDGLLDFIDHVARWAAGPILLLALGRPELVERRPPWGGEGSVLAVYLDALTEQEVGEMLEEMLGTKLPDALKSAIAERCEGNPLFGEEIVRTLIDRSIIRPDEAGGWEVAAAVDLTEIPRSIHALLAARLDSLSEEEKSALQDAAVIGRTFWMGAVDHLSGRSSNEPVGRLRAREIVVQRETSMFSDEVELFFRHVLIRDVAYESLPKLLRADKHAAVAAWAQEHAGERREEIAELLATHYLEALRYLDELGERNGRRPALERDALRWSRAAGERARRLWEQRDAVRWLRSALELAARCDASEAERAALWEAYALAGEGVEPYRIVEDAFARALELYDRIGDGSSAGRVEAWLAFVALQLDEDVLSRAEHAVRRLEPLGEGRDLALALTILGWYHRRHGRADLGEAPLRLAVDMAARVGEPVTQVRAMVALGRLLYQAGKTQEGIPLLERALEVARHAGDLTLLLRAYIDLSEAHEEATGDYLRAESLVREGLELARKAGHVEQIAWMQGNLSDCLFDLGRLDDEVEEAAQHALRSGREVGEIPRISYTLVTIAARQAMRGEIEEAERTLEELPGTSRSPEPYVAAWRPFVAGLLAQARGDDEEAARVLHEGVERLGDRVLVWGGQNMLLEAVRCLARAGRPEDAVTAAQRLKSMAGWSVPARAFADWAEGLLEVDPAEARAALSRAADRFEALGRRVELGRCLLDLAEAKRRAGQDPTTTTKQAREVLERTGASLFLRGVSSGRTQGGTSSPLLNWSSDGGGIS